MLSGNEIIAANLIRNFSHDCKRKSSYDLRVGSIVYQGTEKVESYFDLEPGGIVWLVTEEYLTLSDDTTGISTLKTAWTQQGIFALNVGVVDPSWKGMISTAVANFGEKSFRIKKKDPFFRIVFFKHNVDKEDEYPSRVCSLSGRDFTSPVMVTYKSDEKKERKEYLKKIAIFSRSFPTTFLNYQNLVARVVENFFSVPKTGLKIALIGLYVALVGLPMAVIINLNGENREMSERIFHLEREVDKLKKE